MKTQIFKAMTRSAMLAFALGSIQATAGAAALINGGFEANTNASNYQTWNDSVFSGWKTTASDHEIEIWKSGFLGVSSYSGGQHAELNANEVSTLYQDVSGIAAGSNVRFAFAHRGRDGTDEMRLTITDFGADNVLGTGDDTVKFTQLYSDGPLSWGYYSQANAFTATGNTMRFAFESVSSYGGPSYGNFLDAVEFGVATPSTAIPEPSSIALTIFGFAGLAFSRRTSRKAAQALAARQ